MSNKTITATLKIKTQGLTEAESAAERLKKKLQSVQEAASSGFRGVMGPSADRQGYNLSRAASGATGASARDFAEQAQGLGGLVRIYATFAANIFAVSAAFNALARAMDTTIMVRGLDQLGAAVGKNLGTLAREVESLTEGAISLREAMDTVAKASSAGLSNAQIKDLAVVAKNASQALGLNMTDAVTRLTRGIAKLEPELIDELGLFTKIGPATEAYARSVGKSATALTDFERRQAFANAVLEEGKQKFGALELSSNPYDRLLASLKNVTQQGLELVNKVLVPIVDLLATNPGVLAAGVAAVAASLLKQAVPAITQFREGLQRAAEDAVEVASRKNIAAMKATEAVAGNLLEEKTAKLDAVEKRLESLRKSSALTRSQSVEFQNIKNTLDPNQITADQLTFLDRQAKATRNKEDLRKAFGDYAAAIREAAAAEAEYNKKTKEAPKFYTARAQAENELTSAIQAASASRIRAAAAETAKYESIRTAFKELATNILEARKSTSAEVGTGKFIEKDGKKIEETTTKTVAGISRTQAAMTALSGSASILATGVGRLVSAFGGFAFGLTAFIAVGALAVELFTSTRKESAATAKAMESLDGAVDSIGRTLDNINKKPLLQQLNPASINAKATAFVELTDAMLTGIEAVNKELAAMNPLDKLVNFGKGLFGKDIETTLTKNLANSIQNAFKVASPGTATDAAKKNIEQLLGIPLAGVSIGELIEKLEQLGPTSSAVKLVTLELQKLSREAQISSAKTQDVLASWEETSKIIQEAGKAFLPSDTMTRIGTAMQSEAIKMSAAIDDVTQQVTVMNATIKNSRVLSLFPESSVIEIARISGEVEQLGRTTIDSQKQLENLDKELAGLKSEKQYIEVLLDNNWSQEFQAEYDKVIDKINANNKKRLDIQVAISENNSAQARLAAVFKQAITARFIEGAEIVSKQLAAEFAKAGTIINQGIASLLGNTEAGIRLRARAEREGIAAQMEEIKVQQSLIVSMEKLAAVFERESLRTQIEKLLAGGDSLAARQLTARLDTLNKRITEFEQAPAQILKNSGGSKQLVESMRAGGTVDEGRVQFIQKLEGLAAKLSTLGAQIVTSRMKETVDIEVAKLVQLDKQIQAKDELVKQERDALNLSKQLIDGETAAARIAEKSLSTREIQLDTDKKLNELQKERVALEVARDALAKRGQRADVARVDEELARVAQREAGIKQSDQSKRALADRTLELDLRRQSLKALLASIDFADKLSSIESSSATAALDIEKERLSIRERMGMLDAEAVVNAQAAQERSRIQLETAKELSAIEQQRRKAQAEFDARQVNISQLPEGNLRSEAQRSLDTDIARENALYVAQKRSIDAITKSKLEVLEASTKVNVEEAKLKDIGTSLVTVFGNLGTSIEGALQEFTKYASMQKAFALEEIELKGKVLEAEQALANARSMDEANAAYKQKQEAEKRLGDLTTTRGKAEESATLRGIAATKKLFSEKTAAYRILSGIEKAMHIAKLVMWAKENGAQAIASAKSMALTLKEAAVDGTAAVVKALKGPFPFNIAAAAAVAAVVASLLGRKPNVSGPTGMTREERQETQGTGTTIDLNTRKRIETGGGVFGDATEKSNSVEDSLARIKETSVKGLSFSNRMVDILESIDKGINGAAKALYSVAGIRTGSLFNTSEGSSTSGIMGLFGKQVTREISDAGIKFSGTFKDVMDGVIGSIRAFEEVTTTTNRSGFLGIGRSTSTSTSRSETNVGADIIGQFQQVFSSFGSLFKEAGKSLGIGEAQIVAKLEGISLSSIEASLRGLKGEELEKELNAVISNILDSAANAIFGSFAQYREFGEGMAETVLRITDADRKVKLALESMGKNLQSFTGLLPETSIEITQALVNASGGLSEFISKTEFFNENFLSSSERLVPIQRAVSLEMARLGFASVDTKEEFKNLVLGLDLTNAANRDTYTALMNVAEAFNQVYSTTEKTISAEELKAKLLDFEVQKLKLLGRASQAVNMSREAEIEELRKYPAAEASRLIAALKTVRALEDLQSARKLEIDLLKAQGFNYSATIAQRELELMALTDNEKAIKRLIFAQEDSLATQNLALEVLEAEGRSVDVVRIRRQRELNALSATDAAMKVRLFRLQDEKQLIQARSAIEQRIYDLLGNSSKSLAIARKRELESTDESLRGLLEYQFALEDEAALREKLVEARDRETDALESTIDSIMSSVNALKSYRQALLNSEKSTLTPIQKYEQAKTEAQKLAAIAIGSATTEAEKRARQDAVEKLPEATDKWLEASRTLFASSEAYTSDFNSVLRILDLSLAGLEEQKSEAQVQLEELQKSTSLLESISESSASSAQILVQLLEAQANSASLSGAMTRYEDISDRYNFSIDLGPQLQSLTSLMEAAVERIAAENTLVPAPTVSTTDPVLVGEVIALREQVVKLTEEVRHLRDDQAAQTAQMIATNVAVTQQAAQAVSGTVKEQSDVASWLDLYNRGVL